MDMSNFNPAVDDGITSPLHFDTTDDFNRKFGRQKKEILVMIEKWVKEVPVLVFSKTYSPHCEKAMSLLNYGEVKFEEIKINMQKCAIELQCELYLMTD